MESVIEIIRLAIFFIGCIPAFLISVSIKLIIPAVVIGLLLLLFTVLRFRIKKLICFILILISSFLTNIYFIKEQDIILESNKRTFSSLFGITTLILLLIYIGMIISTDKKNNNVNENK